MGRNQFQFDLDKRHMDYKDVKTLSAEHYTDPNKNRCTKSQMYKREPAIKNNSATQDYFNTTLNQIDPKEIKKILSDKSKFVLHKRNTEC